MFQRVKVVQVKKTKYAMLKPAPSKESVMSLGRMRLMRSHAIVAVTGLTAAIHTGKRVSFVATKNENRMDAIMMKISTGA